jgi:UDP-N-acetylmuramate--alanine ligase
MILKPGQHIHIVGIGGSGMSAIARVLLQKGFTVSGSDRSANDLTRSLAKQGVRIYEGHAAANVSGADAVIITSAVQPSHVEVVAARSHDIPTYKRADIIAELMDGQVGIAIAGTHGKTTTTSMTTHILLETLREPSYIIGGVLRSTGHNAAYGKGAAFVIEADEYDHMFLGLRPQVAVITSIEWDHPDFFPTPKAMTAAFRRFARLLPDDGTLIACADDAGALEIALYRRAEGGRTLLYSAVAPEADWRAAAVIITQTETRFAVWHNGEVLGEVRLRVPGRHNVLNALAAIAAAHTQGVGFAASAAALATFEGAGRRFEVRGEKAGVVVIDDYAHHPTAIRVTLAAAKARYPDRAIWAVWQPHTFSRTQSLFDEYLTAFADADHVLVTDIYAAREQPRDGVTSAALVDAMTHPDARHTPTFAATVEALLRDVTAPAAILIMSAGDAPEIGIEYLKQRA